MIGRLLKTQVDGAIGRYAYTTSKGIMKITETPNESIVLYLIAFLKEKVPNFNGSDIIYSWVFPTLNPDQEQSLQTPAVSVRLVSKVRSTLGHYISDIRGNIVPGYLFDGLLEVQVIETSDYNTQRLSSLLDNALLKDGTVVGLFDYLQKMSFAEEQGFSDTYKLNFTANYRTPSEGQYVYKSRYNLSYTAETSFEQEEEVIIHKLNKISGNGIGRILSSEKYISFKFKIVE